jgi:hypothetical protein
MPESCVLLLDGNNIRRFPKINDRFSDNRITFAPRIIVIAHAKRDRLAELIERFLRAARRT